MIWRTKNGDFDLSQRALVMGILNVTVDSFSDGGKYLDVDAAAARAREMTEQGADIIDIGGESTRPGAEPVSAEVEIRRVIPVINRCCSGASEKRPAQVVDEQGTASAFSTSGIRAGEDSALIAGASQNHQYTISIDTSKASVARAAMERGASIINDVTGLRGDPEMLDLARATGAGVIIMHMQGTPRDMQHAPKYENVITEIREFFRQRFEWAVASGIEPERIAFDPGIGFGKTSMHNLLLIKNLAALRVENRPLVLGVSRKSFIGKLLGTDEISARDLGTGVLTALGCANGANIFRVHDVKANVQALRITEAVLGATASASP